MRHRRAGRVRGHPATGACAEVTAHGTELELRCHSGPADGAAGLITVQVAAVLTASAGDGAGGSPRGRIFFHHGDDSGSMAVRDNKSQPEPSTSSDAARRRR